MVDSDIEIRESLHNYDNCTSERVLPNQSAQKEKGLRTELWVTPIFHMKRCL